MAWQGADICDGQLASSKTTMFTASGPVLIGEIILTNTSGVSVTFNIYVNRTGTSRRIMGKDQTILAGGELRRAMSCFLANGDTLEGDASSATTVDYVVSGAKDA